MKKQIGKNVIAPLTARSTGDQAPRDGKGNPWLTPQVHKRLEDGRSFLTDLATDLPFAAVLRGRVAPPNKHLPQHIEPFCQVLTAHAAAVPGIDLSYLRDRSTAIARIAALEQTGENFMGLLRRTRAVLSAQIEKAMRTAYAAAREAEQESPELGRALQPFAALLGDERKRR